MQDASKVHAGAMALDVLFGSNSDMMPFAGRLAKAMWWTLIITE